MRKFTLKETIQLWMAIHDIEKRDLIFWFVMILIIIASMICVFIK